MVQEELRVLHLVPNKQEKTVFQVVRRRVSKSNITVTHFLQWGHAYFNQCRCLGQASSNHHTEQKFTRRWRQKILLVLCAHLDQVMWLLMLCDVALSGFIVCFSLAMSLSFAIGCPNVSCPPAKVTTYLPAKEITWLKRSHKVGL